MLYNPSTNSSIGNHNLNAQGSQYAQDFNRDESILIEKATNALIFDAAPQQFYDLKLLNMNETLPADSDEFFYQEMGDQRSAIVVVAATAGAVTYPNTVTVQVANLSEAATDLLIGTPANNRATIVEVLPASNEIVLKPQNGGTIEQLSVDDELYNLGPIEADGTSEFAAHFRAQTTERYNYVQLFNRAIRYGEVELFKLRNRGATSNFLSMERQAMFRQFRLDMSNAFWNGKKGEVVLSDGSRAKTTGGVYNTMLEAGSPVVNTPLSSVTDAFEQLALDTEYGEFGHLRFFFGSNQMILKIGKAYKNDKTRYRPADDSANIGLSMVNIGSSNIVLVPYDRFRQSASFPSFWGNQGFLLDMENIKMRQMWNERMGETTDDRAHGGRKRYMETWIDANMGVEFNNPLACGLLKLS